jgi:bacterial/archaeal transporter family-2 protein
MLLAGFCLSIQGPINSRLRLALESPVFAAAISFLSGGFILLCQSKLTSRTQKSFR